jgi:hypothetical protein
MTTKERIMQDVDSTEPGAKQRAERQDWEARNQAATAAKQRDIEAAREEHDRLAERAQRVRAAEGKAQQKVYAVDREHGRRIGQVHEAIEKVCDPEPLAGRLRATFENRVADLAAGHKDERLVLELAPLLLLAEGDFLDRFRARLHELADELPARGLQVSTIDDAEYQRLRGEAKGELEAAKVAKREADEELAMAAKHLTNLELGR